MHIAFIADSWEELNPEIDSTVRLIHESCIRGHRVGLFAPGNLTVRDNETYAYCNMFSKNQNTSENILTFYKKAKLSRQMVPLKGFDTIFIRKNPPVHNLVLSFLDSVKNDTFMINDVDGLRKAGSKIYSTTFDEASEYVPETHVSKDVDYLESVIKECTADKMILKPLDGYGGKGVILLETKAQSSIRSLLEFYVEGQDRKNYVILQEYIPGADQGDIRVLMLNGEPIGAMKRTPKEGDARSNVHAGGTASKYSLNKQELELCRKVGQKLIIDGIYFAGIDIINNKLIEVNVLSPGGITRINSFNKVKLQRKIVDFAELIHRKREDALNKKIAFRKAIENA
ncbi:MAG: glutathione synthase [Bacteriovoracaceae bacterium]|nr:glutathione synthase [Bacteriovoracaceae bacterium]